VGDAKLIAEPDLAMLNRNDEKRRIEGLALKVVSDAGAPNPSGNGVERNQARHLGQLLWSYRHVCFEEIGDICALA
jgi:hypothetical protein